jgi:hypothetical protein
MMNKLGIHDLAGLIKFAIQAGHRLIRVSESPTASKGGPYSFIPSRRYVLPSALPRGTSPDGRR